MKLAISNLSWDKSEDKKIIPILQKYKIKAIEVAPTKIWKDPTTVSKKTLKKYKEFWEEKGIAIVATTSLFFGHPELTLFDTPKKTLDYLKKQALVANNLGANVMMFGSPKNRIKGELSKKDANKLAVKLFRELSVFLKPLNIFFAIEANPTIYGGDYVLTTREAINLAKLVNRKNFGINLDSSTIASNHEGYIKSVRLALPFTHHAHISEPYLKPIPDGKTNHKLYAKALKKYNYQGWLSIEMPLQSNLSHLTQIQKTLNFVVKTF